MRHGSLPCLSGPDDRLVLHYEQDHAKTTNLGNRKQIDRRYALSEAAAAIRYLEQGRARGKVVVTLE